MVSQLSGGDWEFKLGSRLSRRVADLANSVFHFCTRESRKLLFFLLRFSYAAA